MEKIVKRLYIQGLSRPDHSAQLRAADTQTIYTHIHYLTKILAKNTCAFPPHSLITSHIYHSQPRSTTGLIYLIMIGFYCSQKVAL